MKDRFKCRAIDVENGEWRYGYYAELPCGLGSSGSSNEYADTASFILCCTKKQSSLYSNAEPHEVIVCEQYRIVDKTLSQCTGLRDKNGKLIFEGDIIRQPDDCIGFIVWQGVSYWVESPGSHARDLEHSPYYESVEVIGNIYENPELLEAKNE